MSDFRDFMTPGRSMVHATGGMAATSHPLATATALDMLRRGGNAVDAGIAACAVLAVVEPHQTGIGGDCFAIYAPASSGRVIAYNGSGRAPSGATPGRLRQLGLTEIPESSPHAVTIPGAVEAWHRLATDHGTMPFGDLLRPAIDLAEGGAPMHERFVWDLGLHLSKVRAVPDLADLFLKGDQLPRPGEIHVNRALGRTLRQIAESGPGAFYEGEVAAALCRFLAHCGGLHVPQDFAAHRGAYVAPVAADYGGYTLCQCPPNGQGVIALLILRILAHLPKDPTGPIGLWRYHSLMEAARIAFHYRDAWLCDPDHHPVDWMAVLDDRFTREQADRIAADRVLDLAGPVELPEHRDTVYLAVVDGERNAFSLINSLFDSFGSGLYEPRTGVLLQSRGRSFSLDPGHPNAIGPGKRPMHTIIPAMLTRNGRAVMPFGVMGGHFQPVGHAFLLTSIVDYGLDLQRAADLPRCFPQGGSVWVEAGLPREIRDQLERLGHRLADRVEPLGGAQAIWIDHDRGVLSGASDFRKDGCALGFQGRV